MNPSGKVIATCISKEKGTPKSELPQVELIENWGIKDDAHAGNWHRQVSLLSHEKVEEFRKKGGVVEIGDFGENLLISGIDFALLPVGTLIKINEVVLSITQIGKECHNHCVIYQKIGDCIMPREGVFAQVIHGGTITKGDWVYVEQSVSGSSFDSE